MACTYLTGHLPGQDHRWQECPTYHDDDPEGPDLDDDPDNLTGMMLGED